MSHTYLTCLIHVVFSTRNRRPLIAEGWRDRLHAMLGGIARDRGFPTVTVGGVEDHVHALISLPATLTLADAMRTLKATSSSWVNSTFFPDRRFAWQEGYGAFSIGLSARDATVAYIRGQVEHHRERSFQDEFRDFLTRHGIACDERYLWG
jgi:REP element-mobilizing transposase RayT